MAVDVSKLNGNPAGASYKDPRVRLLSAQPQNIISRPYADCSHSNAAYVFVTVTGSSPSATVTILGSTDADGIYLALVDPNATQTAVTANKTWDVVVGAPFIKVQISSISGTFLQGQGFTVDVVPYIAGGIANINITNTASQNIAQVLGATVSATNPLPTEVSDGTNVVFTETNPGVVAMVAAAATKFAPAMTAATAILLAASAAARREFFVQNLLGDALYLGNTSGVTNATLFFAKLNPGDTFSSNSMSDAVYGYSVAGGAAYTVVGFVV